MDLSHHRLNSFSEIDALVDKIGAEKFYQYQDAVFNIISKLSPGQTYNVLENVKSENQGVFIKCVCIYIIRTKGECNVIPSDDYTFVKGITPFNEGKLTKKNENNKKSWYREKSK